MIRFLGGDYKHQVRVLNGEITGVANVDLWARGIALAGLALSIWTHWKSRTTVRVFLGTGIDGDTFEIANDSPHAISVVQIGLIEADGSLTDWWGELDTQPSLPHRIDARAPVTFVVHEEFRVYGAYQRMKHGRIGCFARTSTGDMYFSVGRITRMWWWVVSVFDRKQRKGDIP